MFKLLMSFALMAALSAGEYVRPLVFRPFPENYFQYSPFINNYGQSTENLQLCTYSDVSYEKCIHTVGVARNNSIPLYLDCIRQDNRESCVDLVENGIADMVVLTGHGYMKARSSGLRPLVFAKEDDESLYIAVAPRNITFIGVQEAPIYFDHSIHRAFHAAIFFNLRMGHDICSFMHKVSSSPYIYIVDAAKYVPNSEEILICPDRVPAEFENYKRCNVEAGLQRAVFVRSSISSEKEQAVREIFGTIKRNFDKNSETFQFFDTFQGQDDVIFKKSTVAFDFVPTYRNGVDEIVFNELHCNEDDQPHDPRLLL